MFFHQSLNHRSLFIVALAIVLISCSIVRADTVFNSDYHLLPESFNETSNFTSLKTSLYSALPFDKYASDLVYLRVWPHEPIKNVSEFVNTMMNLSTVREFNDGVIRLRAAGSLGLVVFVLFGLSLFLISILHIVFFGFGALSCLLCCCGCTTKDEQYGQIRLCFLFSGGISIFLLLGLAFFSAVGIIFSGKFAESLVGINEEVENFITVGNMYIGGVNNIGTTLQSLGNNTGSAALRGIVNAARPSMNVYLPSLNYLSRNLTMLSTNLTEFMNNTRDVNSTISQFSQNVTVLTAEINSINQQIVNISSQTVEGNAVPAMSNPLNGLPNTQAIDNFQTQNGQTSLNKATEVQAIVSNATTELQAVDDSLSETGKMAVEVKQNVTTYIDQFVGDKVSLINSASASLKNTMATVESKHDEYWSIAQKSEKIRSDATKIFWGLMIVFALVAALGILFRKKQFFILAMPAFLLMTPIVLLAYHIHFFLGFVISEVCYSGPAALNAEYEFSSTISIIPMQVILSCGNESDIFTIQMNNNASITALDAFGLRELKDSFARPEELVDRYAPGGSIAASVDDQVNILLPDLDETGANNALNDIRSSLDSVITSFPALLGTTTIDQNFASFNNSMTFSSLVPTWSQTFNSRVQDVNTAATNNGLVAPTLTYSNTLISQCSQTDKVVAIFNTVTNSQNTNLSPSVTALCTNVDVRVQAELRIERLKSDAEVQRIRVRTVVENFNSYLTNLTNKVTSLRASVTGIQQRTGNVTTSYNNLSDDIVSNMTLFRTALAQSIKNTTGEVMVNLKNTMKSETNCRSAALAMTKAYGFTCNHTRNTFNGVWITCLIAGLILIVLIYALLISCCCSDKVETTSSRRRRQKLKTIETAMTGKKGMAAV